MIDVGLRSRPSSLLAYQKANREHSGPHSPGLAVHLFKPPRSEVIFIHSRFGGGFSRLHNT